MLPQHITSAPSVSVFLKAFLFSRSFPWLSLQVYSACAVTVHFGHLYRSFYFLTYLLTYLLLNLWPAEFLKLFHRHTNQHWSLGWRMGIIREDAHTKNGYINLAYRYRRYRRVVCKSFDFMVTVDAYDSRLGSYFVKDGIKRKKRQISRKSRARSIQ